MLPALNDAHGNARWLETMRERRRQTLSAPEWELLGQAALALHQLARSARPSTLGLEPAPLTLHNELHRMAASAVLEAAEQVQLQNAARLLWGFAHGMTGPRLAALASRG